MSDADELARRYFALWADYLTALVADPQAAELLRRWIAFTSQFAQAPGEPSANSPSGNPFAALGWPPTPAAARSTTAGPAADAASAAGASRQRDDAVGELTRRVTELERRVAALKPRPKAARPRKRDRASRTG